MFGGEKKPAKSQTYIDLIEDALGMPIGPDGVIEYSVAPRGMDEAHHEIARIRHIQKQLRAIKKDVNQEIRQVRTVFQDKRAALEPGLERIVLNRKWRGILSSGSKAARGRLRHEEQEALTPYNSIKKIIDQIIQMLDGIKLQLDGIILAEKQRLEKEEAFQKAKRLWQSGDREQAVSILQAIQDYPPAQKALLGIQERRAKKASNT